jgi:ABC-type antimicrobial peptide transport system permease subunit
MMGYSVNRRRREIGVRMAMGAGQRAVLRLVLLQGMRVVAIGVAVGIAAALALARMLAHQLYGVGASDPISFIAAPVVLMAVAALACYWPARRASRVDPLAALRDA